VRIATAGFRRAVAVGVGAIIFAAAVGCSGDKPAAASQQSDDALKKEAETHKQMRAREAGNR
jgi:hypothetical protein